MIQIIMGIILKMKYQMEVYNDCGLFVYIDRPFYHYLKTNDGSITTRYKADLSEKFQHLWHIIEKKHREI